MKAQNSEGKKCVQTHRWTYGKTEDALQNAVTIH